MTDDRPERPTRALLYKIIAVADDVRGDRAMRRAAKRKLALYHRYYPDLLRVKTPNDPAQSR
jgi:hypothetical protein